MWASRAPASGSGDLGEWKGQGLEGVVALIFPVPTAREAWRDGELEFVGGAAHATLSVFPDWKGAKLLVALARHMYWFLVLRSDLGAKRGDVPV